MIRPNPANPSHFLALTALAGKLGAAALTFYSLSITYNGAHPFHELVPINARIMAQYGVLPDLLYSTATVIAGLVPCLLLYWLARRHHSKPFQWIAIGGLLIITGAMLLDVSVDAATLLPWLWYVH